MTTILTRGPGRPALDDQEAEESLMARYWQHTVSAKEGCRLGRNGSRVLNDRGRKISLQRVGMMVQRGYRIPENERVVRTCNTRGCVAGFHWVTITEFTTRVDPVDGVLVRPTGLIPPPPAQRNLPVV